FNRCIEADGETHVILLGAAGDVSLAIADSALALGAIGWCDETAKEVLPAITQFHRVQKEASVRFLRIAELLGACGQPEAGFGEAIDAQIVGKGQQFFDGLVFEMGSSKKIQTG